LVRSSAAQISDLVAKGQNLKNRFDRSRMEKGGLSSRLFRTRFAGPPYWQRCRRPSSPRNRVPGTQTNPLRRA